MNKVSGMVQIFVKEILPCRVERGKRIQGLLQEFQDGRRDDGFLWDALQRHPGRERGFLVQFSAEGDVVPEMLLLL